MPPAGDAIHEVRSATGNLIWCLDAEGRHGGALQREGCRAATVSCPRLRGASASSLSAKAPDVGNCGTSLAEHLARWVHRVGRFRAMCSAAFGCVSQRRLASVDVLYPIPCHGTKIEREGRVSRVASNRSHVYSGTFLQVPGTPCGLALLRSCLRMGARQHLCEGRFHFPSICSIDQRGAR